MEEQNHSAHSLAVKDRKRKGFKSPYRPLEGSNHTDLRSHNIPLLQSLASTTTKLLPQGLLREYSRSKPQNLLFF